jgi:hypothetical protein
MLKTLSALLVLFALSASMAVAQPTVLDSKGRAVGPYFPLPLLPRPALNTNTQDLALVTVPVGDRDVLFLLPVTPDGYGPVGPAGFSPASNNPTVLLDYPTVGCTGPAYLAPLVIGLTAQVGTYQVVANRTLYYGAPEEGETIAVVGVAGGCQTSGLPIKMFLSPARQVDLHSLGFEAPFRISE